MAIGNIKAHGWGENSPTVGWLQALPDCQLKCRYAMAFGMRWF
jgi:hypothetical protein